MNKTVAHSRSVSALLVGLTEEQATLCRDALVPFHSVDVMDALEASDRIPVDMPSIVIVPPDFSQIEVESIRDSAVACGAEVLTLPVDATQAELSRTFRETMTRVEKRRESK